MEEFVQIVFPIAPGRPLIPIEIKVLRDITDNYQFCKVGNPPMCIYGDGQENDFGTIVSFSFPADSVPGQASQTFEI